MKKILTAILVILIIPCFSLSASANMVWPSLYIEKGVSTWWIILSGLLIEVVFIRLFTKSTIVKSFVISIVINVLSALIGIIAIPLSGIIGEIVLIPVDLLFKTYTFHFFHWVFAYIIAILTNLLIEGLGLKFIFKYKFKDFYIWLFIANAITIIICIFAFGFEMSKININ